MGKAFSCISTVWNPMIYVPLALSSPTCQCFFHSLYLTLLLASYAASSSTLAKICAPPPRCGLRDLNGICLPPFALSNHRIHRVLFSFHFFDLRTLLLISMLAVLIHRPIDRLGESLLSACCTSDPFSTNLLIKLTIAFISS